MRILQCTVVAAVTTLPGALAAQTFRQLSLAQLPAAEAYGRWVDADDLDGDHDLDLVFFRAFQQPLVYRNQGQGRFVEDAAGMPIAPSDAGQMRFVDVDGDRDRDLVMTRRSVRPLLWRNQAGVFTDQTATAMPTMTVLGEPTSIVPIDIERDGDLDLFFTTDLRGYLLVNNGAGVFSSGASRLPNLVLLGESAVGDFDGDLDFDLIAPRRVATAADRHFLLRNDGTGVFADVAAASLPAFGTVDQPGGLSSAVGDVDGDGDLDIVAGHGIGHVAIYRNGGGTFALAERLSVQTLLQCPWLPNVTLLRLGDLDGDGDLDLLLDADTFGRLMLHNDGLGNFTPAPHGNLPQARQWVTDQLLADVDGDGDLDIVQATPRANPGLFPPEANSVLCNDGTGRFIDAARNPVPSSADKTVVVTCVDLDRDGLTDLLQGTSTDISNNPTGLLWVFRNQGNGTLLDQGRIDYDQNLGAPCVLATGDVDEDGWPDAYVGTFRGHNLLLRNVGDGRLTVGPALPVTTTRASAATFADVDGDGDLDLVTTQINIPVNGPREAQANLWFNDGRGNFTDATATALPQQPDDASRILAFDLEPDGDLDLFFAGTPANRLLTNDGTGHFVDATTSRLPAMPPHNARDAAAADLDGDGVMELLVAADRLEVYRDVGQGHFVDATAQWNPSNITSCYALHISDLDHDGRIDVLMQTPPTILRNLPTNRLQSQGPALPSTMPGTLLSFPAYADFDGDSDLDLLHAAPGLCTLHWNLDVQIELPYLSKPGTTVPMRIHADPGGNTNQRPAFFAASLGRLRIATPFGTQWLDPSYPISIQAALLSAPGGTGEVPLVIGPWLELQGESYTVQGLVMTDDLGWATFTNALTVRIH